MPPPRLFCSGLEAPRAAWEAGHFHLATWPFAEPTACLASCAFQKDMRGTDFLQRSLAKTHRGAALTEAKPEQAEKTLEKGSFLAAQHAVLP